MDHYKCALCGEVIPHPMDVEVQVDPEHVTLILRGPERVITLSRAELQALLDANK
jgi:hypothetical protein